MLVSPVTSKQNVPTPFETFDTEEPSVHSGSLASSWLAMFNSSCNVTTILSDMIGLGKFGSSGIDIVALRKQHDKYRFVTA
jgi:hypothetical protein